MNDKRYRNFMLAALAVALLLAGAVSFYASSSPDGLEKVAEDKGFLETANDSATADSPLADYSVKGVDNERFSVGLAGIIGVGITLALAGGLFITLRRLRGAGAPRNGPERNELASR